MGKLGTIEWVEETDSTQEEVRRHISDHDNLSVIAAMFQTAGRGQRGNTWFSSKGENLTFSVLLKFGKCGFPPLKASGQFAITRAATLGVAAYLEEAGIKCSVKWPNDIYVGNRKICGMLVENVLEGEEVAFSIVGIGLNVNQMVFPGQLANPVSMSLVTGRDYEPEEELQVLCGCLASSFGRVLGEDGDGSDESEYIGKLYRIGEFHEYTDCSDGSVFEGRILGVTGSGMLRVEKRNGELKQFAFKEINYII